MRDWDQFLRQTPWFLEPSDVATVGDEHPWSRPAVDELPQLTALLESATVTPLSISGTPYELLAWGPPGDRRGWLGHPPLDAEVEYVVAVEANGNLTLAHRRTGQLLLFASDHAFTEVTPLNGCPPYSLYTFDHQPDLATWIEDCATAWQTDRE